VDIVEKVTEEAINAQKIIVDTIKRHRFNDFELSQCKGFVDFIEGIKPTEEQSKETLNLYKNSVVIHYGILSTLTKSITPKDTAFLEWQQIPVVLEILYEKDKDFRNAVEEFAKTIDEADDIVGLEAIRVHTGFYGLTSLSDPFAVPGSVGNVIAQLLERTSIERRYKEAILAAKTWGLNTSYVFGERFTRVMRKTRDINRAIRIEKKYLKNIWLKPVETQWRLMKDWGQSSYDREEYFQLYKKKIESTVKDAYDSGAHIANIVNLPTHVGDVGHHIGPGYYNLCRDQMVMAILESVTAVMKRTLEKSLSDGLLKNIHHVMSVATGACSASVAEIMSWDGFTSDMITHLFVSRFPNYVRKYPFSRSMVGELHNYDFIELLSKGEAILENKKEKETVAGVKVELFPLRTNTVLNHPEWFGFPFTAISTRATALLRFADLPCLLSSEPPSIMCMVNAAAMMPDKPLAPTQVCKRCVVTKLSPPLCNYCWSTDLKLG
jgi:hypothetical protein